MTMDILGSESFIIECDVRDRQCGLGFCQCGDVLASVSDTASRR